MRRAGVAKHPPTSPQQVARETMTVTATDECHGRCTWCYKTALGRGSQGGGRRRRAGEEIRLVKGRKKKTCQSEGASGNEF